MCIGLLSASAIACSKSLIELIPLAVETVRAAFRLGSCVGCMAESLEPAIGGQRSWTSLVTGVDSKTVISAVDSFNKSEVHKFSFLLNEAFLTSILLAHRAWRIQIASMSAA